MPIPYKLLYMSGAGGNAEYNTPFGNAEVKREDHIVKSLNELNVTTEDLKASGNWNNYTVAAYENVPIVNSEIFGIYLFVNVIVDLKYNEYDKTAINIQLDQVQNFFQYSKMKLFDPYFFREEYTDIGLTSFGEIRYRSNSTNAKGGKKTYGGNTPCFSSNSPLINMSGTTSVTNPSISITNHKDSSYFSDEIAEYLNLEESKVTCERKLMLFKEEPELLKNFKFHHFFDERDKYFK